MPLSPFPNMIAPIYYPGRNPALAKTLHWTIPFTPPKMNKSTKHAQNVVTGSDMKWAVNGKASIIAAFINIPVCIFTLSESLYP